jgi:hypothetical protein
MEIQRRNSVMRMRVRDLILHKNEDELLGGLNACFDKEALVHGPINDDEVKKSYF